MFIFFLLQMSVSNYSAQIEEMRDEMEEKCVLKCIHSVERIYEHSMNKI